MIGLLFKLLISRNLLQKLDFLDLVYNGDETVLTSKSGFILSEEFIFMVMSYFPEVRRSGERE